MTTDATPDLEALCAELAEGLDEITSSSDGASTSYSRGDVAFARVAGSTLDVRLPGDIAEAALRTQDTANATERGWVRFTPADSERHVTDRAEAWFYTGWRHAERT
jgi:hypothetical protein